MTVLHNGVTLAFGLHFMLDPCTAYACSLYVYTMTGNPY